MKNKHFEEQDSFILFKDGKRMSISTANRIKLLECFKRLNRDSFQTGFLPFTFRGDSQICFKNAILNDVTINIFNVGAVFPQASYNEWEMYSNTCDTERDTAKTEIWFKEGKGMIDVPTSILSESELQLNSNWLMFPYEEPQFFVAGEMIQFIKKSL